MRILIISTVYFPYHLGGAEISTQLLAENLYKVYNYEITILSHGLCDSKEVVNNITVIRHYFGVGSKIVFSDAKYGRFARLKGKLIDIIKVRKLINFYSRFMEDYDIVIISGNARNMGRRNIWIGSYLARVPLIQIVRDPVLLFYKNGLPSKYAILDALFRYFSKKDLKKVPYIIGPTRSILLNHEQYGIRFNNAQVIPNSVYVKNPQDVSYVDKENVIIYVGSVSKPKGCVTLLKSMRCIHEIMPEVRLVLVGMNTGIDIPNVDYIDYKGYMGMDDVYSNMAHAKVLVLPSEWEEAFGRTVVEAIFNGTIAICSNAGGTHELLNDNSEFIFESGNSEDLIAHLIRVLQYSKDEYEYNLRLQKNYTLKYNIIDNTTIWNEYLLNCLINDRSRG